MITFKNKHKISLWHRLCLIFGADAVITTQLSNITFDEGESLIIHHPDTVDISVAVRVRNGKLTVLVTPFDEIDEGVIVVEKNGMILSDKAKSFVTERTY